MTTRQKLRLRKPEEKYLNIYVFLNISKLLLSFKCTDSGSIDCAVVQLVLPICYCTLMFFFSPNKLVLECTIL